MRALNALIFAVQPALVGAIAWRLFAIEGGRAARRAARSPCRFVVAAPLATPDAPLTIFWTLALAGLVEVWRGRSLGWACGRFGAGASVCCRNSRPSSSALNSWLAMLATPSLRSWFFRLAPYLAAGSGRSRSSRPSPLEGAEHGWATFAKQFGRVPPHGFAPHYLDRVWGPADRPHESADRGGGAVGADGAAAGRARSRSLTPARGDDRAGRRLFRGSCPA